MTETASPSPTITELARVTGDLCDAEQLAAMAREGNIAVLDRVTRCFGEKLLAVGLSRCGTEADAEDAVQDAMVAAAENLESFRGEGSLRAWLARMVANACHRKRRGRKNDPALHVTDEPIPTDIPGPEREAMHREIAREVRQALLDESPEDRAIFLLSELEGWKGPEIAEAVGLTHGAVRTRLSRMRRRVREATGALGDDLLQEDV